MSNDKNIKQEDEALKHPFCHSIPVQIRFNDIDTLGHVNNSVYFPFFDLGKAKYFDAALNMEIDWKTANVVVANINCDFCAPIYFNENIAVETKTTHIYDKSFKMRQQIIDIDTREVKCVCTTTMVGFDPAKGISASINDEWKSALENFEGHPLSANKQTGKKINTL